MKKFISMAIAVIMIFAMAVPTYSDDYYWSGAFTYGSYAPVIQIESVAHPEWAVRVVEKANGNDGTFIFGKSSVDRDTQLFVVLPAKESGYYYIREFGGKLRYLTLNDDGTYSMTSGADKDEPWRPNPTANQTFGFVFHKTGKSGGKTVRNYYTVVCKAKYKGKTTYFHARGYGQWKIKQINH